MPCNPCLRCSRVFVLLAYLHPQWHGSTTLPFRLLCSTVINLKMFSRRSLAPPSPSSNRQAWSWTLTPRRPKQLWHFVDPKHLLIAKTFSLNVMVAWLCRTALPSWDALDPMNTWAPFSQQMACFDQKWPIDAIEPSKHIDRLRKVSFATDTLLLQLAWSFLRAWLFHHFAWSWQLGFTFPRSFNSLHACIIGWQRSIINDGFWTSDQHTDFSLQCTWRLPPLTLRLAKARLLYAFHAVREGPQLLIDYLTADQTKQGWFQALRNGLQWLSTLDGHFCSATLFQASPECIIEWLTLHADDGPRHVRRLFKKSLMQLHVLGDALDLHHQMKQTLQRGGVLFQDLPPQRRPTVDACFQCQWCVHHFDQPQKLQAHMWMAHQIISDERKFVFSGTCLACKMCFWSAARLQQHLRLSRRHAGGCFEQLTWRYAPLKTACAAAVPEDLRGFARLPAMLPLPHLHPPLKPWSRRAKMPFTRWSKHGMPKPCRRPWSPCAWWCFCICRFGCLWLASSWRCGFGHRVYAFECLCGRWWWEAMGSFLLVQRCIGFHSFLSFGDGHFSAAQVGNAWASGTNSFRTTSSLAWPHEHVHAFSGRGGQSSASGHKANFRDVGWSCSFSNDWFWAISHSFCFCPWLHQSAGQLWKWSCCDLDPAPVQWTKKTGRLPLLGWMSSQLHPWIYGQDPFSWHCSAQDHGKFGPWAGVFSASAHCAQTVLCQFFDRASMRNV